MRSTDTPKTGFVNPYTEMEIHTSYCRQHENKRAVFYEQLQSVALADVTTIAHIQEMILCETDLIFESMVRIQNIQMAVSQCGGTSGSLLPDV